LAPIKGKAVFPLKKQTEKSVEVSHHKKEGVGALLAVNLETGKFTYNSLDKLPLNIGIGIFLQRSKTSVRVVSGTACGLLYNQPATQTKR
jgi:hypothetical protein